jgi:hypothetical protein
VPIRPLWHGCWRFDARRLPQTPASLAVTSTHLTSLVDITRACPLLLPTQRQSWRGQEFASDFHSSSRRSRFENDVVARWALTGGCLRRRSLRRPVVLGEDKHGEIDLVGELDRAVEGRDARVEDRRPRVDVGYVAKSPG